MRFSWTRGRSMMVVSATLMALQGVPALAQFVPYNGNQNQGYNQYQAQYSQQMQPVQQAQPQYMQAQPQYVASAYQGGGSPTLTQPTESIAPGQVQPSAAPHAAPVQAAPMHSYSSAPAAGCNNCQPTPAAPAPMSYESYPTTTGYAPSTCGTYNTFDGGCGVGGYGAGAGCGTGYLGGRRGCGRRWFGGIYGLYMERDGNPWKALAFSSPTVTDGYYPTDNEIVLNLTDIDNDTFAGAEVRFGSTLGGGSCGCGPRWAWEFAYWGLAEDTQTAIVTDTIADGTRLYSMMPQYGIEYNPGSGYRPVNDYFDHAPPVNNPTGVDDVRIRQLTVRNTFSAQNIELNMLRLPICGGGYYSAAVGAGGGFGRGLGRGGFGGLGSSACGGGCDAGGCGTASCGSCGAGCGVGGCGCGYRQRYSVTSVLGVRYLRLDEDFMFRSDFDTGPEAAPTGSGFLSRNVDVDNHLIGAQFGCNGIYHCGCTGRWALHCNSVVGIYGNHMEVWNRLDVPTGGIARTTGDAQNFDFRYEDDDIAFIGELRAGASYQYSCHCRLYGGYRMLGLGGVALAFDQISPNASTAAQVQYVDSDGSIFIHGLQAGVEWTY